MDETLVKSGILEWNEENIEKSPSTSGIYVLTNSPTNGSALDLKYVDNLRTSLTELMHSYLSVNTNPQFFYWYVTSGEEAKNLVEQLNIRYNLNLN